MTLKVYENEHYEILVDWWKKQDWQALPADMLSPTGFISYDEETPIAAGFLYNTDSNWAVIEWVVGNPDVDHEKRSEGLDLVLNGLLITAEGLGKKYIQTIVEHKRLIERYKNFKFMETDKNMTVMIRSL